MRIFQFGKTWFSEHSGGGSDRVFAALAQHLPAPTTSVRSFVFGDIPTNGASVAGMQSVGKESEILPVRWYAMRRSVTNALREQPPDIVTSHFALYTLPVLDRLSDLPLVTHFHGPWAKESRMEGESSSKVAVKEWVESRVYRRSEHFIVLSEAFRDILIRDYGIDGSEIEIVPGGVEFELFDTGLSRQQARMHLDWPTDRPILLAVRRLVHRVGLGPLIEALTTIQREVPDILLMIAGKGPLRTSLEQKVKDSDLADHVRFLGFVPDANLPAAYRAANLSVMPTQGLEGFGLSAVESLAAGTPVAVTPVGGLPSIVSGLSEGLIFDDSSVSSLAGRLADLLRGSVPLPTPEACQSHARDHFDWSVIADRTRSVYQEVIA